MSAPARYTWRKLGAANRTQAVLLAGRLARDPSEITALPEGVE